MRKVFDALAHRTPARTQLVVGRPSEFPEARDRAYCEGPLQPGHLFRIVVSPRLACESMERVHGVLRHELAHAALSSRGKVAHTEREADREAERLFGARINYDNDIQTIGAGVSPRPEHLSE
jgi:hypothetical protein